MAKRYRNVKARISEFFLLLAVWTLFPIAEASGPVAAAESPFRFYSTVDGLTQSDVYDIGQDSVGYLWITTARGLNRYDGREFSQYTIANGLPSNDLTVLHIDADDTVWVGDTRGGIAVIRGSRVVAVIPPIGDEHTPIRDIEVVGERIFAVAADVGILEVVPSGEGYRLEPVGEQSIDASDLVVSGSDVWVLAATGLYELSFRPDVELQRISENIRRAHAAADGTLWVVDLDNRVGIWIDGNLEVRAMIDAPDKIRSIATSTTGTVWVATYHDLFNFENTQPNQIASARIVREFDGVASVWSPFVDRENTFWFAGASGLTRFLGDRFRHFPLRTGSDAVTVWAISEDASGRLWFGTETQLLVREDDETLTVIGSDYGVPTGAVLNLVHSVSGDLWISVADEGLFLLEKAAARAERISGTEGLYIMDIGIAPDGAVWFSTMESGVFRYTGTTSLMERFHSFGTRSVNSLDISKDGSVWYVVDGVGVVTIRVQASGSYEEEVFEAGPGVKKNWFGHIQLTGDREAWVTGEEGGLYRFASGHFSNPGADSPWADQTVYLVEVLENGTLVLGGEQGLYQFSPQSQHIAHYGEFDGFVGVEVNTHATFLDSEGCLWIGTVDGATRMDTSLPMPRDQEPIPHISSIDTELDRHPITENGEVDPGQRGIRVEFAAVSLNKPNTIEFSYKLVGITDEWGAASSNRIVNYSGIPPGSYQFMIRARYEGGRWGRQLAVHNFTVLPFVWQQAWFRLCAVILIVLIFWAVITYRTQKIKRMNKLLRAEVADRTRSIEQTKNHLQSANERLHQEVQKRQVANKALLDIEKRFRQAFDSVPIGMGLLDAEGRLFDTNPALQSMFFAKPGRAVQALFTDTIDAADRQRFTTLYQELTMSGRDRFEENIRCIGASGDILHVAVSLSAVRSESGDLLYSVLQVQDVTESRKLTDQLEYHASYDDLTGLLNRRSFESELQRAWESSKSGGANSYLLYMDLDQFKLVNDTAGHAAGDQLLLRVSEIVVGAVRTDDTVCRLGGDEFGIILWDCPTDVAFKIAESIRTGIEQLRFQWDSQSYRIGASIGGLLIIPDYGSVDEIQQLADSACYAAKDAGRNRVHIVSGGDDSARVHRGQIRWVHRLREAMDDNRFEIYSQVIKPLNEEANEPECLEIVLQLRDVETGKLMPPSAFLPAAERYGFGIEMDQWVVRNLFDTISSCQSPQSEHRHYWVKLSGTSIGDESFASFLMDAIKNSPLPPGTFNFEIAETAVIRNIAKAGQLMLQLRELGCQFALDDFGSALSSFDYLKKLPVDYLKIDGSLIRDLLRDRADQIFVRSIIEIAHAMYIKTIVASVDNQGLLKVVKRLGADFAQGSAISAPFELLPENLRGLTPNIVPITKRK